MGLYKQERSTTAIRATLTRGLWITVLCAGQVSFAGQSLAAVWTRHEGSPSLDGRYWGLTAENEDWSASLWWCATSNQIG